MIVNVARLCSCLKYESYLIVKSTMHFPGTNVKDKKRIKFLLLWCGFFYRYCVICMDISEKILYIIKSSNVFITVYVYFKNKQF